MSPHSYTLLLFDKGAKKFNGEKTASSTNIAGDTSPLFELLLILLLVYLTFIHQTVDW
jgi:hypothetical protein